MLLFGVLRAPLSAEFRSFDAIFPGLPAKVRAAAFSAEGYFESADSASGLVIAGGTAAAAGLDPGIGGVVLDKTPGFVSASLRVIPAGERSITLLEVYNALGNIRGLKGRVYHSATRQKEIALFEDATRLESARKSTPIPDPRPAQTVPPSETVYIRLKDANFGNSYYRGDLTLDQYGLRYRLSTNRNINYLFIPVIKEEQFCAQLYFEPIAEGILIYSVAGADVSDFVSSRIDMPSAIGKRLAVIIAWVTEGIGKAGVY
jgi:hypothetical protein